MIEREVPYDNYLTPPGRHYCCTCHEAEVSRYASICANCRRWHGRLSRGEGLAEAWALVDLVPTSQGVSVFDYPADDGTFYFEIENHASPTHEGFVETLVTLHQVREWVAGKLDPFYGLDQDDRR